MFTVCRGLRARAEFLEFQELPASHAVAPVVTETERIVSLARSRRWSEVATLAEQTVQANPVDRTGFYWLGVARFQLRDGIGAARALRSAEKLGLASADLHIELGQAYYALNQFKLFEEQMEAAARSDPQNGTPPYLLGLYHLSVQSDPRSALTFLAEAVKLRPKDPKAQYQMGYCLEANGQSAEARRVYAQAIDLARENKDAFGWPFQGMARLLLNEDPGQALRFAREAVQLEPKEPSNDVTLAKVYERLGDVEQALRAASDARREAPNDAAVRYLLFRLYRQKGASNLAAEEMKAFQEINAVYGPE